MFVRKLVESINFMKMSKGGQSLALGAAILLASNFIVKTIGALFQILMLNLIGSEVMGLYAAAFKVYAFFFIITTTGLPIAVSRMVAAANALGKEKQVRRIMHFAMYLFVILGAVGTVVMLVFAPNIAEMIKMPSSVNAIRVIAPSVVLICIVSGFRGYFQGLRNMTPTAVSQIIEVAFKLLLGFGAAFYAKISGASADVVAAYVISGVTVGVVFSAIYMLVEYKKTSLKGKPVSGFGEDGKRIVKRIFVIGIPITLTAVIINSTGIIDLIAINSTLAALMPLESVSMQYSWYVNIAETISTMPSSIIVGIGISVLPAVTYWIVQNKLDRARRSVRAAIRITAVLALPCSVGIAVLGRPIIMMLFRDYNQIAEAYGNTAISAIDAAMPSLVVLTIAAVATCLYTTTTAVMQSCSLHNKTIISAFAAVTVKLVTTLVLLLIPGVGPVGAAIGTTLCFVTATWMNIRYLDEYLGKPIKALQISLRPLIASIVCGVSAWGIYKITFFVIPSNAFAVLVTVALAAAVYALAIIFLNAIPRHEILMLPKGKQILGLLERFRLY